MSENIILTHKDVYRIDDISNVIGSQRLAKYVANKKSSSPFVGVARFSINGIVDTVGSIDGFHTNMTIAAGREFACQSIFKGFNPLSKYGDISNYKVDAFGIGKGGTILNSDKTYSLINPSLGDVALYDPIPINPSCLPMEDSSGNLIPNIVKMIKSAGPGGLVGDIEFEKSDNREFADLAPASYYTICKLTCIIDNMEPMLDNGMALPIDEAMLFATSPTNTNPHPFAHIAFPPKFIEQESVFKIEWFIIC